MKVDTHMFKGVMGHRHGSSLLQIVIPAKVSRVLSTVSIWNTHRAFFYSLSLTNAHNCSLKQSFTRLRSFLAHAGAPSRTRLGERKPRRDAIQPEWSNEHGSKNWSGRDRKEKRFNRLTHTLLRKAASAVTMKKMHCMVESHIKLKRLWAELSLEICHN